MAFQFPDVKADFTAPNGITYTWDAVDEKWRVKSFTTDSVAVTISDVAPADPNEGDLWFDSDEDSLTTFIWTGSEWIPAAPPVSLDSINAVINSALIVQEELLDRVGAGEVIQTTVVNEVQTLQNKVAALEGGIIDAVWTFEADSRLPRPGEFALRDGFDAVVSDWSAANQIIINPTDYEGETYTFDKVSVNDVIRLGAADGSGAEYRVISLTSDAGYFNIEHITSHGTSADEIPYSFTFLSSFDPTGLASIEYVDNQDDLKLDLTGGTMTGHLKLENKEFVIQKPDGSEQLRIHPTTSGYFTNINAYNGGGIRFRASAGDASSPYTTLISISNDSQTIGGTDYNATLALNRVRTPNNNDQAANKWYVDNAISNADIDGYLPLDGGTMSGALSIDLAGNKALRIIQNGTEHAQIWADGTFQTDKTSFGPQHLVTKNYIDSTLAPYVTETDVQNAIDTETVHLPLSGGELTGNLNISEQSGIYTNAIVKSTRDTGYAFQVKPNDTGDATAYIHTNGNAEFARVKVRDTPTNNSDLTTKEYVDNAVTAVSTGPASLAWEWRNHDTLSDPGETKAAWYSSSNFFRLNLRTANGVFLGKNVLSRSDISFNQHLTGGIWRLVSGDWQMVQLFQIHRMQWNHNNCVWLYRNNIILGGNNFTAGEKYYFTVGGFF